MSSQDTPSGAPQPPNPPKPEDSSSSSESAPLLGSESIEVDAPTEAPEETWEDIPDDVKNAGADEIVTRARLIDNDIRVSWGDAL